MIDTTGIFTKKDKQTAVAAVAALAIAGLPVLIFVGSAIQAYVISTLWGWYIVPFFGMKPLPLSVAFGISLMVNYLQPINHSKDERKSSEKISQNLLRPVLVLLFGWVGTHFL